LTFLVAPTRRNKINIAAHIPREEYVGSQLCGIARLPLRPFFPGLPRCLNLPLEIFGVLREFDYSMKSVEPAKPIR
jgi:hypothetical protein